MPALFFRLVLVLVLLSLLFTFALTRIALLFARRFWGVFPLHVFSPRALRRHNNDVGAALAFLTAAPAPLGGAGTPGGGGGSSGGSNDEALAVLQSLGVPPEAARQVLSRTGTLCDALRELGISGGPDGEAGGGGGGGGGSSSGSGGGGRGRGASDSGDDESQGEDDESSEGGGEDDDLGSEPTPEEKRLFGELAADRENQDDEGYLDVTLEDEADAADM